MATHPAVFGHLYNYACTWFIFEVWREVRGTLALSTLLQRHQADYLHLYCSLDEWPQYHMTSSSKHVLSIYLSILRRPKFTVYSKRCLLHRTRCYHEFRSGCSGHTFIPSQMPFSEPQPPLFLIKALCLSAVQSGFSNAEFPETICFAVWPNRILLIK